MTPLEAFQAEGAQARLFDYPLTPESIVFDVGGYKGAWTSELLSSNFSACPECGADKKPRVFLFEPIREYADEAWQRLRHLPSVEIVQAALGSRNLADRRISKEDACSSVVLWKTVTQPTVSVTPPTVRCQQYEIEQWCQEHGVGEIELMSINIEGAEYELISHLVAHGFIQRVNHLQVQFHDYATGCDVVRKVMQQRLSRSHDLQWEYSFVWESWKRR